MYEGLEFRHLRYVLAVAEECHFGRAAERLHVSQPALSHQIKQLEEGLRTALFVRSRHGAALTPSGRELLPIARQIMALRTKALRVSSSVHASSELPLRFGYSPFVNHDLVGEAIGGYKELVPGGELQPHSECSGRLVAMVRDGKLDAALVSLPVRRKGLVIQKVCDEDVLVCLRHDDPLANCDVLPQDAIAGRLRVLFERSHHPLFYDKLLQRFDKAGIDVHPSECVSSPAEMQYLVTMGYGFGLAGTGKTTVLASIREGAEKQGYTVEGFAPSSRAAGQLRDAGIRATTLQSFIARGGGKDGDSATPHLYMLDESSLASTKQMRAFLDKIGPNDRVLVIGDTRQHQAVDAGRPFQQMLEAGMRTSQLSEIVRQKDPALLKAVELLAKGETAAGVKLLADQGRITEIANGTDRIAAISKDYAAKPENTLIISPDNRSRVAINQAVRTELQANGTLSPDSREFSTLTHRSDMTGADRMWAARYSPGDVLQYTTGSKAHGIERDSYATVRSVDAKTNTLTVERGDGELVSYDPKRLKGVNVYREVQREIAVGERIQFTAPHKGLELANRDLGTVTKIEPQQITVKMDGQQERVVTFNPGKMRHFEYGYAVTSHSAQGLTAGRIIANMDG